MIDFLSGAITLTYLLAGVFFLRFWRKTQDRLFLAFAVAFWLFAVNQMATFVLDVSDERAGYSYVLRVAGFILILLAIIDKNTLASKKRKEATAKRPGAQPKKST